MSFATAIQTVFRKYAAFEGRASRPELWWWILFASAVSAVLDALTVPAPVLGSPYPHIAYQPLSGLGPAWSLAVLVPTLAVAVRRLRDAGYPWAHLFWLLLPLAGLIVVIVLLAQPSARPPAAREPSDREPQRIERP